MSDRKNTTFSIVPIIKKEFKIQCAHDDVDMSDMIEGFMKSYTKLSKSLRDVEKEG